MLAESPVKGLNHSPKRTHGQRRVDLWDMEQWIGMRVPMKKVCERIIEKYRALGISISASQVEKDWVECLDIIRKKYTSVSHEERIARINLELDMVKDEAWRAWKNSHNPIIETTTTTSFTGETSESVKEIRRGPDTAYLRLALTAGQMERDLKGLDAPRQREISNQNITTVECVEFLLGKIRTSRSVDTQQAITDTSKPVSKPLDETVIETTAEPVLEPVVEKPARKPRKRKTSPPVKVDGGGGVSTPSIPSVPPIHPSIPPSVYSRPTDTSEDA